MNVEHENVVFRSFHYIFDNKAFRWYFHFPVVSITNLGDFENDFIDKLGEDSTPTTLLKELIAIIMDTKERVKDFNQYFTTILNKLSTNYIPYQEIIV